MSTPLRALLVEDRPADAKLVLHQLRSAGYEVESRIVDNEPDFVAALADPRVEVGQVVVGKDGIWCLGQGRYEVDFVVDDAGLQLKSGLSELMLNQLRVRGPVLEHQDPGPRQLVPPGVGAVSPAGGAPSNL